jgi:hypothetical protein
MGNRIIIIRDGNKEQRPHTIDNDLQHYSQRVCANLHINLAGRRTNRD